MPSYRRQDSTKKSHGESKKERDERLRKQLARPAASDNTRQHMSEAEMNAMMENDMRRKLGVPDVMTRVRAYHDSVKAGHFAEENREMAERGALKRDSIAKSRRKK